jgi:hypothetical protein
LEIRLAKGMVGYHIGHALDELRAITKSGALDFVRLRADH